MTTGERFVQFLEHVTNDRSTEFAWINLPPSCIIFIPSMVELVENLCAPRYSLIKVTTIVCFVQCTTWFQYNG